MAADQKPQVAPPGVRKVPGQKDYVKFVPKDELAKQTRTRRPGEAGKEAEAEPKTE
jgi:hypothetical protein